MKYFNPPSPCGEGPGRRDWKRTTWEFQSTLPVWGGTRSENHHGQGLPNFNPPSPWGEGPDNKAVLSKGFDISIHPPRGGRDMGDSPERRAPAISIHPPRGGRDLDENGKVPLGRNFNPPSPWGEGLIFAAKSRMAVRFQSTLPVGGGTPSAGGSLALALISIHPPRGGRDQLLALPAAALTYFNPPSPWGEGRSSLLGGGEAGRISIHPPREGRDLPV